MKAKQLCLFLFATILSLVGFTPKAYAIYIPLLAEHVKIGDLYYDLSYTGEAIVTVDPNSKIIYPVLHINHDDPRTYDNNYDGLTEVEIPSSVIYSENGKTYPVTRIRWDAFNSAKDLKKITIPSSVTYIGYNAFYKSGVYNDSKNWYNGALYVGNYLIEVEENVKQLVVKEGTRVIGEEALGRYSRGGGAESENTKLESIYFPNTVEYIGMNAFRRCTNLKTVTMSNSIKVIEDYAFRETAIESITLPNTLEEIGGCVFEGTNIEEVSLPRNTECVGLDFRLFANCSKLKKVVLPEQFYSISTNAFQNCTALREIYSASNRLWYKEGAFDGVDIAKVNIYFPERFLSKYEKNWQGFNLIPERFLQDGIYYKLNDEKKSGIVAPETSGSDNYSALVGAKVTIPGSIYIEWKLISGDITRVFSENYDIYGFAEGAFSYSPIQRVTIEASIIDLAKDAFANCANLTDAVLPNSVTEIGENAFGSCSKLENIPGLTNDQTSFLPQLDKIGAFAFADCIKLPKLRLRNASEIGEKAFINCSSVTDIILGASVAQIGKAAFAGCTKLEKVTNLVAVPQAFPDKLFDGIDKSQFVIYVHRASYEAFKAADGWKDYNIQIIPEEVQYFTVYLEVNDTNAGTVSGAGLYEEGTEVTVTATPKEGYRFVRWSDGETKASYTFTLTQDVSLQAVFEEDVIRYYYDLILQSNSKELGRVSGSKIHVEEGTVVPIEATPADGCEFQYWTDSKGTYWGKITEWTVTADEKLIAHFRVIPDYTEYLVYVLGRRVTSSNANDILGDGVWSYDRATHTLSTMKDATYKKENVEFIEDWETKLGALNVVVNHQITVEVTSTDETIRMALYGFNGMRFVGSKLAFLDLTALNMYAVQMQKPLEISNHLRFYVTHGNTTEFGKANFTKAMLLSGTPALRVDGAWARFMTNSGNKVSNVTDAKLELVNAEAAGSMEDTYLEIHDLTPMYGVNYQTESIMDYCLFSGGGSYYEGEQVTLRALPATSYEFVRWSNGVTDNPYTFIMPAHDVLIDPIVQGEDINPDGAFVNAYAPVGQGHIKDDFVGGWFASGTVVTITAVSEEGYNFVKWDDDNTDNPRIITAEAGKNMSLLAQFAQKERFTVTFLDWDDEVLSVEKVYKGDDAQVPQTPVRQGYTFDGWEWIGRGAIFYGVSIPNIRSNETFRAQFNINTYIVRFFDIDGMQIGEDQMIEYGGAAVAPDAPEVEGYTFLRWNQFFNYVESDLDIYALYEQNQSEGIEDIRVEDNQTRKVMMDGVLYILRGDKIYTIQGAEVK